MRRRVDSVAELGAPVAHEVLSVEAYAIGSGRTHIEPQARHRPHPAENRRILRWARSADNLPRCAPRTNPQQTIALLNSGQGEASLGGLKSGILTPKMLLAREGTGASHAGPAKHRPNTC